MSPAGAAGRVAQGDRRLADDRRNAQAGGAGRRTNSITPERLVAGKLIPENLHTAIMTAKDLGPDSLQEAALANEGLNLWQSAYARFNGG